MNAPLSKKFPPYNPDMLRWARTWSGKTFQEVADKLKKDPEEVSRWEDGKGAPTVRQARILADFYGRHFLEFFLAARPNIQVPNLVPDFRMHAGIPLPHENRELQEIQQWTETQRINALDLFSQVGGSPRSIPQDLFVSLNSDPEESAKRARSIVDFSIHDQIGMREKDEGFLPTILRGQFEKAGILVLKNNRIKEFKIRGICVAEFPLPVIVFHDEAPTAQAFTLVHEFAHVLMQESGITGSRSSYNEQPVERWCDQFAAAFLMPREQIQSIFGNPPVNPAPSMDDEELKRRASIFRVSQHAMLIRLVHLQYVDAKYYWGVKKPLYDEEEKKYKRYGRTKYYGSRYRASLGDLYTGLVLEAWGGGYITNHNAAEYMGIKNIKHLNAIRDALSS